MHKVENQRLLISTTAEDSNKANYEIYIRVSAKETGGDANIDWLHLYTPLLRNCHSVVAATSSSLTESLSTLREVLHVQSALAQSPDRSLRRHAMTIVRPSHENPAEHHSRCSGRCRTSPFPSLPRGGSWQSHIAGDSSDCGRLG